MLEVISLALERGFAVRWVHRHEDLIAGDVCFILSYQRIIPANFLSISGNNLVVHASSLPEGKGWSPMSWQILEGKNVIPLSLFEATTGLDDGPIYLQTDIKLTGCELIKEWQQIQAHATIKLCLHWLKNFPNSRSWSKEQQGDESFFPKRSPKDSLLDVNQTIASQFDLIRIVDNESYPLHFNIRGSRYVVKVNRLEDSETDLC